MVVEQIAGLFSLSPCSVPNLRVSPLGVVPKKTLGEFRLIYHLLYPRGASIKDAIPPPSEFCSIKYASIDQQASHQEKKNEGRIHLLFKKEQNKYLFFFIAHGIQIHSQSGLMERKISIFDFQEVRCLTESH